MKHVIDYSAPPADDKFHTVDAKELGELILQIRVNEESARLAGGWYYDAWQSDINAATLAAEQQDAFGATVLVAQDEDGYYFATKSPKYYVFYDCGADPYIGGGPLETEAEAQALVSQIKTDEDYRQCSAWYSKGEDEHAAWRAWLLEDSPDDYDSASEDFRQRQAPKWAQYGVFTDEGRGK